ncbi:MAG: hypothetical protein KAT17_01465 [Candidatus Aminicenantes bacterium]|nr:hypothetical protein [Candidatus Aminicenantes bacterium]
MKNKLLIFMMIGLIFGFLFHNGCKTEEETENGAEYDITGTWQVTTTWSSATLPAPGTYSITFSGTATNGTFFNSNNDIGTYLVIGTVVQLIYSRGTVYTGQFTSETTMEGEIVGSFGDTGTWSATKSTQ